jgi:hypothetical protein
MTTFFYRFESEAEYKDAITTINVEGDVVEPIVRVPHGADVIGVITKIVADEPITLDGWHVNLPYAYEPWAAQMVTPLNPFRIFWGS